MSEIRRQNEGAWHQKGYDQLQESAVEIAEVDWKEKVCGKGRGDIN
jgi:hypothetical protein